MRACVRACMRAWVRDMFGVFCGGEHSLVQGVKAKHVLALVREEQRHGLLHALPVNTHGLMRVQLHPPAVVREKKKRECRLAVSVV